MTRQPVASFYVKDGIGFTTAEGAALLEKAGGSGGLPFKVVSADKLERLMTGDGPGHVISLSKTLQ
ncbi:MAG: hypothetical protein ACLPIG_00510 [Methylocella sp.]|jgi:hypothetical protein